MSEDEEDFSCPLPIEDSQCIEMAHGGGGQRMHDLLRQSILPRFDNPQLASGSDAAIIQVGQERLAFTTDSFVVNPPFFAGGDIGVLAVCGTLNDLATAGATPRWLSAGLIIEEGFPLETLETVLESMAASTRSAGVELVTGDTKVVERGQGDGIYINTAGIGVLQHAQCLAPGNIQAGDAIVVSGDLGRHGIAVLAAREGMREKIPVVSDVGPIHPAVSALLDAGVDLHCVRDLTRGGLASALVELSGQANLGLQVAEADIPVTETVRWACELFGFDPLYVANEGRFAAFVPAHQVEQVLAVLREMDPATEAAAVGVVTTPGGMPTLQSRYGPLRRLAMLSGEQMPRIC